MVIFMNFNPGPLRVEYRKNGKAYFKQLPTQSVVGMTDLVDVGQISNETFLIRNNVTILNYNTGVYLNRNGSSPVVLSSSTYPFVLVGKNSSNPTTISSTGFSGTATTLAMTFTANAIPVSTVYTFSASSNSLMALGTISAVTAGNFTTIRFSGASTVSTNNYIAAISSGATLPVGVTITGGSPATLGAGSTVFLSASTAQGGAGYVYLQRIIG